MPAVLVLGASGYVGSAVACAFRHAGWLVFGQTRSMENACKIAAAEVIPVVCEGADKEKLRMAATISDVVVDATGNYTDMAAYPRAMLELLSELPTAGGQPRLYIYTSGCLVYGNQEHPVCENSPRGQGAIASMRGPIEDMIQSWDNPHVSTVITRPSFIYGRGGGGNASGFLFQTLESRLQDGKVKVPGCPKKKWNWVHIDDVASCYLAIARAPRRNMRSQIFNVSAGPGIECARVAIESARRVGFEGSCCDFVSVEPWGFYAYAEVNVEICSSKAREVLGWTPIHNSFCCELGLAYLGYCGATHTMPVTCPLTGKKMACCASACDKSAGSCDKSAGSCDKSACEKSAACTQGAGSCDKSACTQGAGSCDKSACTQTAACTQGSCDKSTADHK